MHPKKWLTMVAMPVLAVVAGAACTTSDVSPTVGADPDDLPDGVTSVMEERPYRSARWGIHVVALEDGDDVPYSLAADDLAASGSTGKLFSVGTALDVLGIDHTVTTPVYALGDRDGPTLRGDLVLVGAGDLVLGGRQADQDAELGYSIPPQTVAQGIPGAKPAPGNPLAGLEDLAAQVAAAGITSVEGNVVVDDRLWQTWVANDGPITPIVVNDNLVGVLATPTQSGEPATLELLPDTSAFTVDNQVGTVASGEESSVTLEFGDEPFTLVASGPVAEDADPFFTVAPVEHPATFARALFVEALGRAGVTVNASASEPNSTAGLPAFGSYADDTQVAAYESPPLGEIATLIWKISHNVGADMMVCLLAVHEGSDDCTDGFAPVRERITNLDIDQGDIWLLDGAGGSFSSVTPTAVTTWLTWLRGLDWGDQLPDMLPILGVDGSLGLSETDSPAKGKVQAKTGTFAGVDPGTGRLVMPGEALAGFLDADDGTVYVVAVYMINASFADPGRGIIRVGDDLAAVSAALQQEL